MYVNQLERRARPSAFEESEKLIEFIRSHSNNPAIDSALDQLTVLADAHMRDIEELPGKEYNLGPGEQKVLALLLKRRGKVCSKLAILNVCAISDDVTDKSVQVRIWNLRQKLPKGKYDIETIWGVGYRMTLPALPTAEIGHRIAA